LGLVDKDERALPSWGDRWRAPNQVWYTEVALVLSGTGGWLESGVHQGRIHASRGTSGIESVPDHYRHYCDASGLQQRS